MEFEHTILACLPEPRYLRKRFENGKTFKIPAGGIEWQVRFLKDRIGPDGKPRRWLVISPIGSNTPIIGIGTDEQMEQWTNTYIQDESGQIPLSHEPINLKKIIKEAKTIPSTRLPSSLR